MGNRPSEDIPPWRETPSDHWDTDIDPAIMAGGDWVTNDADPASERMDERQGGTEVEAPFLHPKLATNFGLDHNEFTWEGEH